MTYVKQQFFKSIKFMSLAAIAVISVSEVQSQNVSTFDDLILAPDSYWDGSDMSGGFTSNAAFFRNNFNSYTGFAYSNMKNDSTAGFKNAYSSITAGGSKSENYAIGNPGSDGSAINVVLNNSIKGNPVRGVLVSNTTYAYLSMKNGDTFAKKFGGKTGNDPDWFSLQIVGYLNGVAKNDTVKFYLADFRNADNSKDYIINTWKWLDLSAIGGIDSLAFSLSSSDVGSFGMNTPAYFAMDNFNEDILLSSSEQIEPAFSIYPNPSSESINIRFNTGGQSTTLTISDLHGNIVYSLSSNSNSQEIPVHGLANGIYVISSGNGTSVTHHKFIKQ